MPNTFKSIFSTLGNTATTNLYSVPSSTTGIVKSLYAANTGTGDSVLVSVTVGATGSSSVHVIRNGIVPIQSTLQVVTEPIVLEANDRIEISASISNRIDVVLSYMEIT